MNNSVNRVHEQLPQSYDATSSHQTANLCSRKKKTGEPAETNISTIITH